MMVTRRLLLLGGDGEESGDQDTDWDDDGDDDLKPANGSLRSKILVALGVTVALILTVTLLLVFLLPDASGLDPPDPTDPLPPSDAPMGVFGQAAVVANGFLCAPIGRDVLTEGGNAVDAAIATLLCEGAINIQSMGVGGGFLMTIYQRSTRKAVVLNARETAPAASSADMYHGNASLSQRGGLSVAVPGELRGYQVAFEQYGSGNVTWERLFQPTIQICRYGFNVTAYLAKILASAEPDILTNRGLSEYLVDPATGHVLREGDVLRQVRLADTLAVVAGPARADALYNGSLTNGLVQDVQRAGGILTRADLENYRVQLQDPVTAVVNGHTMHSVPPPGSGAIVAFILNLLNGLLPAPDPVLGTHRVVEAFKFGYGRRTELGDFSDPAFVPDASAIKQLVDNLTSLDYAAATRLLISDTQTHDDPAYYGAVLAQPDDHGTAHLCVLAPNGDAVSVTSTINLLIGSRLVSASTGIVLNDEMDDFSAPNITNAFNLPPSPANFIAPGKRPLSSMCPAIFTDAHGDVSLVTGAAGGSKITTATALIAIHSLINNMTIKEALDAPRFHHQLFPMSVDYEYGVTSDVVAGLEKIGHVLTRTTPTGSSSTGIRRQGNNVTACYDYRRGGSIAGF